MRVTQAESWVSAEAMTKEDSERSLRDRKKETIEAWFGRVEDVLNAGVVTRGG